MATKNELKLNISDVFDMFSYNPDSGEIKWKALPSKTHKKPTQKEGMLAFTTRESKGYMVGRVNGIHIKAHRAAWLLHYGKWPDEQVDHINGIPWDNRIENLREVTNGENCKNRNMHSKNKSGWTGVSFNNRSGLWIAKFRKNYQDINVGRFSCPTASYLAIAKVRKDHGFSESHGARGRVSLGTMLN